MSKREKMIDASDRSMDTERKDRSQVFFFPKRNPPVSVRAASREEAEQLLETPNRKEHE
jgi:hypothetical protein